MATTIRELIAKLGVEADDAAVKKFDSAVGAVKDTMLAAAAAAVAVTAAIIGVTVATAAYGDAAAKGATSTGLSVEAYQELQFAAEKAGLTQSQYESALQMQARAAQNAVESNEGLIETANGTTIAVKNANGEMKTQEELLLDTAKAVKAATTEQEKLAIATEVYGRSGAEMLPLLNQGEAGIAALREEAEALGIVMSEETAIASEAFNDSLTDLKAIATGLRNEIGEALLPIMTEITTAFKDWFLANKELINQRLDQYIGYVVDGVEWLVDAAEMANAVVMSTFGTWKPVIVAIVAAMALLAGAMALPVVISTVTAIAGGFSAIASIGLPALLAIVGAVGTVIAYFTALALVIGDIWTFLEGGDSVIGRLIERFQGTDTAIGAVIGLISALMPLLPELWTLAQTFGEMWWAVFSVTTLPVLMAFGDALMFVGGILAFLFGAYVQTVVGNITSLVEWLTTALGILNQFIGLLASADSAASALGSIVGAVMGGSAGADGADGFAPSGDSAAVGAAGSTTNTSVGGNTYQITGVGVSAEEVENIIAQAEEQKNRSVAEQLANGEV